MARKRSGGTSNPFAHLDKIVADGTAAMDRALKDPDSLDNLKEREGNPVTLAPRLPEVDDWVGDQLAATANASEKWKRNTLRPRKSPIAEAKKKAGRYEASMQEALREKRYQKGLDQVDEDAMYATIEATPATAVADGVRRREAKVRTKVGRLRNLQAAIVAELDKMPTDTPEQREAKAIAAMRLQRQIKGKV